MKDTTHMRHPGCFVISLDFELYWGVRHLPTVKRYRRNLVGARVAVPAILDLFSKYGIHATWAVVGFLFFDHTRALLDHAPALRPRYNNKRLSPYYDLPADDARADPESIFFAPGLIRQISSTNHQEVGTHTFSHYYCLERGQTLEMFRQDMQAACAAAEQLGVPIKSLVFPKNHCRSDYLTACAEVGISAYRGNPPSWLYRAAADDAQGYVRRLGRLLDAYIPVTGSNCNPLPAPTAELPIDITASRFLRPYSPSLKMLEPLRLWRIKRDLTIAAKAGRAYHLWWHPHNFGVNLWANLRFLRQILDHFHLLRDLYGLESLNMNEAASRVIA
jgi:peptidoglycan/xylan/chitin deacetylase (PgdA/CDA1 family)